MMRQELGLIVEGLLKFSSSLKLSVVESYVVECIIIIQCSMKGHCRSRNTNLTFSMLMLWVLFFWKPFYILKVTHNNWTEDYLAINKKHNGFWKKNYVFTQLF
jgi:hypothetical protein